MRTTILIATLALVGCSGFLDPKPDDGRKPDWPDLVRCVSDDAVLDLVDNVTDILFSQRESGLELSEAGASAIEELALEHGPETVACVIDHVIKMWTRPGAAMDEDRMQAAIRGRDFLSDVGVKVEAAQ